MHVLTKIFIVLVALLACLLVPLVVVYAHNENAYESMYQSEQAKAAAASASREESAAAFAATEIRRTAQITDLTAQVRELRAQVDAAERQVRQGEAEVAEARAANRANEARLETLAASISSGQQVNESLLDEVRQLRQTMLASERQKVELDEALQEMQARFEVAENARRALAEELQRLKEDNSAALETIATYVVRYGELDSNPMMGMRGGVMPDRNLDTVITEVRRSNDQVLVEIDAGSRDGIRTGWIGTIAASDRAGTFRGRIRIVEVDINRSAGVIDLEDESNRGLVRGGDRVLFRAGG